MSQKSLYKIQKKRAQNLNKLVFKTIIFKMNLMNKFKIIQNSSEKN